MLQLWIPRAAVNGRTSWAALPLTGSAYFLSAAAPCLVQPRPVAGRFCGEALLTRSGTLGDRANWLLSAAAGASVSLNGEALLLGQAVLRHRDEIRLGGARRLFVSTERLAQLIPFPGADHPVFCARCKTEIVKNAIAVRCPQCDSWNHQSPEMPCWLYASLCPLCDMPTALDTGYRWVPETT